MAIQPGSLAPEFNLTDENGAMHQLTAYRGKTVVLYFYPKDDTPGCTKEACAFRDAYAEYTAAGVVVLGISPDDAQSHTKFKQKFNLPFTLLADPGHAVANAYGAWGTKKFMGREYDGVLRTTFVIGPEGHILRTFENVRPEGHAAEVLAGIA